MELIINEFVTTSENKYIPTTQTTISNIRGNIPAKQATTTTTQIVSNYIPSSSATQLPTNFAPVTSTTKTPITFSQGGDSATQLSYQELVPNNISQLIPGTTTSDSTTNLGGLEYTDTQTTVTNIPNITSESPFPKTTIPRIQQSQTNANAFDINKLLKMNHFIVNLFLMDKLILLEQNHMIQEHII